MVRSASNFRHQLHAARDSWSAGNWLDAGRRAKATLAAAVTARDTYVEAQASLLLASVRTLESRFDWARRFASRAQSLHARHHDSAGVADAMLALSYVDSALGNGDLSLQAAEATVAGSDGVDRRSAAGLNYRGVAAFWAGDYGTARGVLDAACLLSREETGSAASVFHPLSNSVFTEVLRCAHAGMQGHRIDFSDLARLLAHQELLLRAGATGSLTGISAEPGLLLHEFASCFMASRIGDAARADAHYLACLHRVARLPDSSWMRSLAWWARLERTRSAGEAYETTVSVQRLVETASAGEHVPMRSLACRLASDACASLQRAGSPAATWFN